MATNFSYAAQITVKGGNPQTAAAIASAINTAVQTLTTGTVSSKVTSSSAGMDIAVPKVATPRGPTVK